MAKSPVALFEPALLHWARMSARLSIDELAEKLGLDPDLVEAWELGYERPSISQLRKLAQVVRRPLAVFFLPEPPLDFDPIRDFRRMDPDAPLDLSIELDAELRRIRELRESAVSLLEDEADDPARALTDLPTSSPEALGAAIRQLLAVTWEQQRGWADPYESLREWKSAVEEHGVLVVGLRGIPVHEARGFSIAEFPLPVIALNTKDSANGRIFTLMHELAHLSLHEGGICEWSKENRVTAANGRTEVFCNAVAAEVLLPEGLVRSALRGVILPRPSAWPDQQLLRLARQLSVSEEALLRRLVSLGLATAEFYATKRERYLEEYEALASAPKKDVRIPYERRVVSALGTAYLEMAFSAYYERRISLSDLSGLAGVRVQHLRSVEREAFGFSRVPGEHA